MIYSHRLAISADLPGIVDIYNSTIASRQVTADLTPVTTASRLVWFDTHTPDTRPIWVAEQDGNIVAWLSFSDFHARAAYRHTAEISIYIHEMARRQGWGRYLLEQAMAAAPGLGIRVLVGLIFGHNAGSLALFEQMGFERWAQMPGVALLDEIERDLMIVGKRVD